MRIRDFLSSTWEKCNYYYSGYTGILVCAYVMWVLTEVKVSTGCLPQLLANLFLLEGS